MKQVAVRKQVESNKLSGDEALQCALIFLQHLAQQMISKTELKAMVKDVAAESAKQGITKKTFDQVLDAMIRERYRNLKNAALDSMDGFW